MINCFEGTPPESEKYVKIMDLYNRKGDLLLSGAMFHVHTVHKFVGVAATGTPPVGTHKVLYRDTRSVDTSGDPFVLLPPGDPDRRGAMVEVYLLQTASGLSLNLTMDFFPIPATFTTYRGRQVPGLGLRPGDDDDDDDDDDETGPLDEPVEDLIYAPVFLQDNAHDPTSGVGCAEHTAVLPIAAGHRVLLHLEVGSTVCSPYVAIISQGNPGVLRGLPAPNVFDDGRICMGNGWHRDPVSLTDLGGSFTKFMTHLFTARANADLAKNTIRTHMLWDTGWNNLAGPCEGGHTLMHPHMSEAALALATISTGEGGTW